MINFEVDGEGKEVLRTSENHFIEKDDFIKRFGRDLSYEALIIHEETTELWKKRFNYLFSKN